MQKVLEVKSARIIGAALAAVIFTSLSGSAYASVGGALAAGEDSSILQFAIFPQ